MNEQRNQETRKCEVCGEIKPVTDFSKSYRNRCKPCVAAEARIHRASQEAEANKIRPRLKDGVHRVGSRPVVFKKARIRATGEIVEVTPQCEPMTYTGYPYKAVDGRMIPACALQFEPEIDWEQRRYEIAKDIYVHRLMLPQERLSLTEESDAEIAVELADSIVEILKNNPI